MAIPAASSLAVRSAIGAALAAVIAARAVRRRSLDASGGAAGFVVMAVHIACGYRYGAMLLAFFFTSSKVTKIGENRKRCVEEDFKEGGQRNWIQVLANSTIATILVVIYVLMTGGQDRCLDSNDSKVITGLIGGIIGHYCCCNGDTWSSEIGVLSDEQPRLITTLKPVRKGTNGGVTLQGLLAATAGGLTIGLTFVVVGLLTAQCPFDMALWQLLVLPISAGAGLLGSLIDSLLGATLQFSGYCSVRKKVVSKSGPTVTKISGMTLLDNDAVNAVSVLLTTVLTAYACICIF
ncbi:protein PGR-like [Phragmites australis]|uniref:protein PGR-like n=1 Tax=Phragmites australis TaxID=29695 RepID=UPI002D766690|nr:protein PGR-like [Phragmites australis]